MSMTRPLFLPFFPQGMLQNFYRSLFQGFLKLHFVPRFYAAGGNIIPASPDENSKESIPGTPETVFLPYDITIYSTRPYFVHPLCFTVEPGKKYRFQFHIIYTAELNDAGSYWGVASPDGDISLPGQMVKPEREKNIVVLEGILEATKEGKVFPWFMPETAGEKITVHGLLSTVEYDSLLISEQTCRSYSFCNSPNAGRIT